MHTGFAIVIPQIPRFITTRHVSKMTER